MCGIGTLSVGYVADEKRLPGNIPPRQNSYHLKVWEPFKFETSKWILLRNCILTNSESKPSQNSTILKNEPSQEIADKPNLSLYTQKTEWKAVSQWYAQTQPVQPALAGGCSVPFLPSTLKINFQTALLHRFYQRFKI